MSWLLETEQLEKVTFCNPVRRDSTERELLSTGACQERYEDSLRQSAAFLAKVTNWVQEHNIIYSITQRVHRPCPGHSSSFAELDSRGRCSQRARPCEGGSTECGCTESYREANQACCVLFVLHDFHQDGFSIYTRSASS